MSNLNFKSWLMYVKDGITNKVERYKVVDDEHVVDTESGIQLHIYDGWFKVTHDDEIIATMRDFDPHVEQAYNMENKRINYR